MRKGSNITFTPQEVNKKLFKKRSESVLKDEFCRLKVRDQKCEIEGKVLEVKCERSEVKGKGQTSKGWINVQL